MLRNLVIFSLLNSIEVCSLEPCQSGASCKCENGLITECSFVKFSFGAIHLKLQNIPDTNFSSDFYMSNDVEDQDWLEPQKDGDTRLLFVDVINSPVRNYSNLLRYLEKIDVKIMSVYFEGAGIAEVSEKL